MKHGTDSAYRTGCRCGECKQAHTAAERKRRGPKKLKPAYMCGTTRTYAKGCRCPKCKEAKSAADYKRRGTTKRAPVTCGTLRMYEKGCKCVKCKAASATYRRTQRGQEKRKKVTCGTSSGYAKGCRCTECSRAHLTSASARRYGITLERANALRAITACNICGIGINDAGSETGHIDHCHLTGQVRGMLCRSCNHMLGHAKDNIETLDAAIRYLEEAP